MPQQDKINYVEFPVTNLSATRTFFETVFGWSFEEYGAEYLAFSNAGLDGGFYQSDLRSTTKNGAALVVLYSEDLEAALSKIQGAGGTVVQDIFSFPGGRRFHFEEPSGNELAVWSEKE